MNITVERSDTLLPAPLQTIVKPKHQQVTQLFDSRSSVIDSGLGSSVPSEYDSEVLIPFINYHLGGRQIRGGNPNFPHIRVGGNDRFRAIRIGGNRKI